MKLIIKLTLAILFFTLSYLPTQAQLDDKKGIHLLHTEELNKAHQLLNITPDNHQSYVTIPLSLADLENKDNWADFFKQAKQNNIIPIVRLVSEFHGSSWKIPNRKDIADQISFLSQFEWPSDERYIIIYNEPNHKSEFGGIISPEKYNQILSFAADWAHTENKNYKVLPAAMDLAAPNGLTTIEAFNYLNQMLELDPTIFEKIDYWNSHSYPNPGFIGSPYSTAKNSLRGFQHELDYIKRKTGRDFKVFITETGWINNYTTRNLLDFYYRYAATYVWSDERVVAVTPFILQGDPGPFSEFSFIDQFNQPTQNYYSFQKTFLE